MTTSWWNNTVVNGKNFNYLLSKKSMRYYLSFATLLFLCSCKNIDPQTSNIELVPRIEAITLLGDTLISNVPPPGNALNNYTDAKNLSLIHI